MNRSAACAAVGIGLGLAAGSVLAHGQPTVVFTPAPVVSTTTQQLDVTGGGGGSSGQHKTLPKVPHARLPHPRGNLLNKLTGQGGGGNNGGGGNPVADLTGGTP